jgi:hypothetical protein
LTAAIHVKGHVNLVVSNVEADTRQYIPAVSKIRNANALVSVICGPRGFAAQNLVDHTRVSQNVGSRPLSSAAFQSAFFSETNPCRA